MLLLECCGSAILVLGMSMSSQHGTESKETISRLKMMARQYISTLAKKNVSPRICADR
jgi:hypothetical protein